MDDLYKHKYRIPSARLQSWDYGTNGAYFVTICTHEHHHVFGEVRNGEMQLNAAGKIAAEIWQLLPNQFPYVVLDEFVVMPNHLHGLLYIDKPAANAIIGRDAINRVCTDNFAWQTRFHDHIVRTNDAFLRIQTYILNNPLKWNEDKFHF